MAEYWTPDKRYDLLRRYVDFCTRRSYREMETLGTLPRMDDAAWIIAYNHTNTLMDALVLLQTRKEASSFGARADVFRNPGVARFLRYCKIIPLARKNRDKPEEVARNAQAMNLIDSILEHGIPFCIAPEGRHRTMHSLLPMRRGIATMAFRSAAQRPTFILPLGLDYSDWFHYRGRVRIHFGEPLDVQAFARGLEGMDVNSRDAALQEELFKRLSALFFFLPDDDSYPERLAAAEASRPKSNRTKDAIVATLTFPLFALSAILALPMWTIAEYLCHFKIQDKAFSNTVRYAVKLLGTPLFALIWALILFLTLPWWAATPLWLLFFPSYSIFYDWLYITIYKNARLF